MYDAGKIIPGLIVFLCLITFPIWYNVVTGEAAYTPEPEIISGAEQCIEPTPGMRAKHMDLLNEWKKSVVRENRRIYIASDNQAYDMSLTGTCLECHSNKAEFCDQCHNYAGVEPYCWECHIVPEGD